jgi:hypothetical protein
MPDAERARRYRERKKAEAAARRGPDGRVGQGNLVSVKHGAFSPALTGERAREIAAEWLSSAACPADAADDPYLVRAVWAVARAEARLERLCSYADLIEAQLGDDAMEEFLTDVTAVTGSEQSEGPPQNRASKDVQQLVRARESLSRAIDRHEARAASLRDKLWKRIAAGGQGTSKRVNAALVMAELDAAERAAGRDRTG